MVVVVPSPLVARSSPVVSLAPVARLAGARPDDVVHVLASPAEAFAALVRGLPGGAGVLVLDVDAPAAAPAPGWTGPAAAGEPAVTRVTSAATLAGTVARVADALAEVAPALVCVPGVAGSGEVLPVAQLADLAHAHGGRLAVDATHLAPAGRLDLAAARIDHAVLAGCELGARLAGAALVGRPAPLGARPAHLLPAGGRIDARALAAVAAELAALPDGLAAHVADVRSLLLAGLATLPGVRVVRGWPDATTYAGVLAFTVEGWRPAQLLAHLAADAPVRLDVAGDGVRARLDAHTGCEDVAALLDAMEDVVTTAPPG